MVIMLVVINEDGWHFHIPPSKQQTTQTTKQLKNQLAKSDQRHYPPFEKHRIHLVSHLFNLFEVFEEFELSPV